MDITDNILTSSSSWDLDISMWNHLLHDQSPFGLVQLLDPFTVQRDQLEGGHEKGEEEGLGAMKEMMYKIAAMQPVDIDPSTIKKPKRRNVRISEDPQSIAARHRRERISERIRILQRLVPGGTKMDTASMLDEAIRYVKFLKRRVQELQPKPPSPSGPVGWLVEPDTRACPSSTSPAVGAVSGLGFGFGSINGPCDGMD